jgi:hypothetical protein
MEFLLSCGQRCKRLACARSKHTPGLGQAAAAAVSLDEPLPRRGFEQAQVLARARLSDADRLRCSRHAFPALDLDKQTQAR